MLASRWPKPFVDAAWIHELKWDGVRALLHWDGERVVLRSRSGNDATARYPELSAFASDLPVVLDGEVVSLDADGRPSFERLQQRMNLQKPALVDEAVLGVPISYVVFDVLHRGDPVVDLPIEQRLSLLEEMALPPAMVRSEVVRGDPSGLWDFVTTRGIEGIVSKRLGSVYRPGRRSTEWRKITAFRQVRAVVCGFTEGEGGRMATFGSLVLGLWRSGSLEWIGSVGSGFSDPDLRAIREALDAMTVAESPLASPAEVPGRPVWVTPRLVALVQYKEWTTANRLRAPSFKGFTDDDQRSVTWAAEGPDAPG